MSEPARSARRHLFFWAAFTGRRRRIANGIFPLVLLVVSGCGGPRDAELGSFSPCSVRFASAQDLPHIYHSGASLDAFTMLETLGGGLSVVDFDLDGADDLCLASGGTWSEGCVHGTPASLLRRCSDGSLKAADCAGIDSSRVFSHGVASPDLDEDGFPDLVITGYGGLEILRNCGDGTYASIDSARLPQSSSQWLVASAAGDLNGDSFCDLYVSGYLNWSFDNHPRCFTPQGQQEICSPREFKGIPDVVLFSQGDWTFRIPEPNSEIQRNGKGLGVSIADWDEDRDLDVYVANDGEPNFLLENDGKGAFRDVGTLSGAGLSAEGSADGSMGVSVLDEDSNGRPDLLVSNYELETNALYHNQGDMHFLHASLQSGISSVGRQFVSWGIVTDDLDCDGDQDVVFSNGHVLRFPSSGHDTQRPIVLERTADRGFVDVSQDAGSYWTQPHHGRAVVGADLDVDGDRDLIFMRNDSAAVLLRNEATVSDVRWLQVQLIGRESPRDPVGGRLALRSTAGTQYRFVVSGDSYASYGSRWLHFGVPRSAHDLELEVSWPSGQKHRTSIAATNRRLIWIEGREPLDMPPPD